MRTWAQKKKKITVLQNRGLTQHFKVTKIKQPIKNNDLHIQNMIKCRAAALKVRN